MRAGFLLTITACTLGFAAFALLGTNPMPTNLRGGEQFAADAEQTRILSEAPLGAITSVRLATPPHKMIAKPARKSAKTDTVTLETDLGKTTLPIVSIRKVVPRGNGVFAIQLVDGDRVVGKPVGVSPSKNTITAILAGLTAPLTQLESSLIKLGSTLGQPRRAIEGPSFDRETHLSLRAKDVTVAVVVYAPKELKWDVSDIDEDVAKYVSHKLALHKIKVITPQRVQAWLDKHPEWDCPDEVGVAFKTTYVVFVEIEDYNLYEKGNLNQYRGRAELNVSVWKMDQKSGEGEIIYRMPLEPRYPLAAGRPTSEITYSRFKKAYFNRVSEEIGRLFYPPPGE